MLYKIAESLDGCIRSCYQLIQYSIPGPEDGWRHSVLGHNFILIPSSHLNFVMQCWSEIIILSQSWSLVWILSNSDQSLFYPSPEIGFHLSLITFHLYSLILIQNKFYPFSRKLCRHPMNSRITSEKTWRGD